ncbi:MAG TPA: DUF2807 domain-containing protein [Actinomycetota bacterium]|nr:DUF2807 domain-containing protein [Actinomycetota bacterium]
MAVPECLVDRYELRGLLGRGGMGQVYDGWDRRLDRPVAVKLLSPEMAADAGVRRRFEAEAQAAARLVHPKVVGVFDTGEHEGTPFIVMERLPGRTLADELAAAPLPQDRVRGILRDMLEALDCAHRAGILHRDIKPSNVLLTETGTAKVADFGIAKTAGRNLTQTGQFVGTASYLSPERLNGLPAGPESDLYSVGVVGFEALSGEKPFKADTPLGLVRAIADDPMPSVRAKVPEVDEGLARAIDTATRRDPKERFQSAAQMLAALGLPAGGEAPPAGPLTLQSAPVPGDTEVLAPTAPGPAGPARRNGRWLAGAALLVLLALAWMTLGGRDQTPPAAPPSPGPSPGAGGEGRAIGGVTAVEFLGGGTLIVEQTDGEESVSVTAPADLRPHVRTDVAAGRLVIGLDPGSAPGGVGAIVYRAQVRRLTELRATGGGQIRAGNLSVDNLTVEIQGSADAELSGETGRLVLSLQGSGNFDGRRLLAGEVTAELNGSGDAVVAVSDHLRAELSGSGNLEYLGDPELTREASGSGEVRKIG